MADRPGATPGEVSDYAEYPVDAPLDDLANPAAAVTYARRADEMTNHTSPEHLELLARACESAGDAAMAAATEEKALALIPPSPARQAAEGRLARFRAELRK